MSYTLLNYDYTEAGAEVAVEKTLKKVYKILDNVTPLRVDCGQLCSGECCKGDSDTGMLLFPGEEKFFESNENFSIRKTSDGRNVLICSGKCDRKLRPVSCRIFPLFPVLADGRIYVFDDPRAKGICPLLYDEMKLSRKFERRVAKAGKLLAENEETSAFLKTLTDEICEIIDMNQKLFG